MSKKTTGKYISARERADKRTSGFQSSYLKLPEGMPLFVPKTGIMLLDILPYRVGKGNPQAAEGMLYYERTYFAHRSVGANSDTYLCPRMMSKKPCPICEERAKLVRRGREKDEDLIRELSPKERQLFLLKNLKDPDKGFQLWDVSYHLFGKMLDATLRSSEEEDEWDLFYSLEDGLTLRVSFADDSFGGVTFCKTERIDFKPRREQYDSDILDELPCLDELFVELSYDKLKKIFLEAGAEEDEDDDEDDDEKPISKHKRHTGEDEEDEDEEEDQDEDDEDEEDEDEEDKKPSKSKKPSKDEDDDDDEEDDQDDEDEDEKPSKSAAKKKSSKEEDEEDDDEEEDEEDEDEDEKPSKSKKPSKDDDEDDWDDFDEDEDDEEEDEKPAKKGSKGSKKG